MATATFCPECRGAKQVHQSVYERTKIHPSNFHREDAWRKEQLNADYTCKVTSEALTCRVCWGRGYL